MKTTRFIALFCCAWCVAAWTGLGAADPETLYTPNLSVSKTNYVNEQIVTNGITLGGSRITAWPGGAGSNWAGSGTTNSTLAGKWFANSGQITNTLDFGAGASNRVYASGNNLVYTNGAANPLITVINGLGESAGFGMESLGARLETTKNKITLAWSDGSEQFKKVSITPPDKNVQDLGTYYITFKDGNFEGHLREVGFSDNTLANYAFGDISHTGTNGSWIFDSQSAGTAGNPRPIDFKIGSTNGFRIANDIGTWPNDAAKYFDGSGHWSTPSGGSSLWTSVGVTLTDVFGVARWLTNSNPGLPVVGPSIVSMGSETLTPSSVVDTNSYSIFNLGDQSGKASTYTNSSSIVSVGVTAGAFVTYSNSASIFNLGESTGVDSEYYDSRTFNNIGESAADTLISIRSSQVNNVGYAAAGASSITDSKRLDFIGNWAGQGTTITGSTNISGFGAYALQGATLTDSYNLSAIGPEAGMGISGTFSNVVLIGSGATVATGTHDKVIFGPTYSLTTGAPAGGTAAATKLGVTNSIGQIEHDVSGTLFHVLTQEGVDQNGLSVGGTGIMTTGTIKLTNATPSRVLMTSPLGYTTNVTTTAAMKGDGTAAAASDLSNGTTGSGSVVLAASPTLTGTIKLESVALGSGLLTNNLAVLLTAPTDATVLDMATTGKASVTNVLTGALTIKHATNGVAGQQIAKDYWIFAQGNQTLTFPIIASGANGWRTNAFSPVPPTATNGTITRVILTCLGPTGSLALQTNCFVSFEYY